MMYFSGCSVVLPITGHLVTEECDSDDKNEECVNEDNSEKSVLPWFLTGVAIDLTLGFLFLVHISSGLQDGFPEEADSDPSFED